MRSVADNPIIEAFFDEPTNTVSYLVADPGSGSAAVIDPVLDYEASTGTVDMRSAGRILARASERGWSIMLVLETHAHADHLSAAPYFKAKTGARIGIGEHIRDVQKIFRPMFAADDVKSDGGDFDLLFRDGERLALGELEFEVMATPGH
ncbi:MAG: MBL fold metallo-hydrolase, partial [Sphingomicrobium sp.]